MNDLKPFLAAKDAEIARLREASKNLLTVLENSGGFTRARYDEGVKDGGLDEIDEPWAAMRKMQSALDGKEAKP